MNSEHKITEIIQVASIASVLAPLVLYLLKRNFASKPIHLIGTLTIVSAISDIAGYILFTNGISTVTLFNSYYVALFLILATFYYQIHLNHGGRNLVIAAVALYVLSFITITGFVQSFNEYQTLMWTLTGMAMIILSISYFLQIFSTPATMNNYELLWINSGVLLYFSLNLFLFLMSSYILTRLDSEISLWIWSFHNINNIMRNVLFGFGVFAFRPSRQMEHENVALEVEEF